MSLEEDIKYEIDPLTLPSTKEQKPMLLVDINEYNKADHSDYKLDTVVPCPFCNTVNVAVMFDPNEVHLGVGEYRLYCKKCGAYGPTMPTLSHACRFWNRRDRDKAIAENLSRFDSQLANWISECPSALNLLRT